MDTQIDRVTALVEQAIIDEVRRHAKEKFWVTHYGANHIHSKHLVYWIVVGYELLILARSWLQLLTTAIRTIFGRVYANEHLYPNYPKSNTT